MSGLTFVNRNEGWVTDTTAHFKQVQYKTTNGGATWRRMGRKSAATVPSTVSGIRASRHGTVPAGLKITNAVRSPGGLTWALATGPATGTYYPTYLLRATRSGHAWATVPTA